MSKSSAKDVLKHMVTVTSPEHFAELVEASESKLVLMDCYADWCGPCEALQPTLQKIYQDYDLASERMILASCDMGKFGECIQGLFPENGPVIDKNGCLPLFLVIRFNALCSHISGVDAPQLLTHIATNMPEKPEKNE